MTPDEIRSLRKTRGLTTRQLADALGVDASLVAAWEAGERFPTRKAADKMSALAGAAAPSPPAADDPWSALRDPGLWTLFRKLAAHRALREKTERLAADYEDPAGPSR